MATQEELKRIIQKVEKDEPLIEAEEMLYITEVLQFTEEQANLAIALSENKDPNKLIIRAMQK